jgi:hypothetical protein
MSGHEAEDDKGQKAAAVGVDESGVVAQGSSEAELFRAGRLSREEFIVKTVERATAHLEGQISPERLEDMRALLASQLDHDPTLSEMLERLDEGGPSGGAKDPIPDGG